MKLDGHQVEKGEGPIGCDPWVIKKRITYSEIRGGGRLHLPIVGVKEHILPNWDKECVDSIKIWIELLLLFGIVILSPNINCSLIRRQVLMQHTASLDNGLKNLCRGGA